MSAKLKIFIVLMLSILVTAVAVGVYKIANLWHLNSSSAVKEKQQIRASDISQENVENQYTAQYKSIPLAQLTSVLKGTDPAALAINAFDTTVSKQVTRKVEVVYPQPNQAMVTITETNLDSSESTPIKYRVKLTSFGRSLFIDSPPLWQIVWAGSSEECLTRATIDISTTACN